MARKKKTEPAAEAAKKEPVLSKFVANEQLVTFYYEPEIKDPKGLIGAGTIITGSKLNKNDHEWLEYTHKSMTVYSLANHFLEM